MNLQELIDVLIIGGSHAGLSAALSLGRSRRKVVIIDEGKPRNGMVTHSHGFYTRDGFPAQEILELGREQLAPYDVLQHKGKVINAEKTDYGFLVKLQDGTEYSARKLLLATGVSDILPDIAGLHELWGKSVYTCPYCHGWEVRDQPLAVLGDSHKVFDYALTIHHWSKHITICLNGTGDLEPEQIKTLDELGISVIKIGRAHV